MRAATAATTTYPPHRHRLRLTSSKRGGSGSSKDGVSGSSKDGGVIQTAAPGGEHYLSAAPIHHRSSSQATIKTSDIQ